jgi:hypothetical protein
MAEDWPSPHHHEPHALPRIEDLPVAWEGYDRERVQAAFDAFYRHIAQLDSTLRTLESVEVFRQQAGELRTELRSIRAAGWAPYPRGYTLAPERSMFSAVPDAVPRIALEVVFLIVVAAVVAVAKFTSLEIVGVMAGAVVLVFLVELIASRDRRTGTPIPAAAPARTAPVREKPEPAHPVPVAAEPEPSADEPPAAPTETEEPVPVGELSLAAVEAEEKQEKDAPLADDGSGWAAFAEPIVPQPLTLMGTVEAEEERPEGMQQEQPPEEPELRHAQAEPVAEPEPVAEAEPAIEGEPEPVAESEPEPVAEAEPEPEPEPEPVAEAEPEPEPELESDLQPVADVTEAETGIIARGRRLRRRKREEPPHEPAPAPKHVRVLPPPETSVAEAELPPWERGFDDTEERR